LLNISNAGKVSPGCHGIQADADEGSGGDKAFAAVLVVWPVLRAEVRLPLLS
jgi:hypothetical protein